MKQTAYILAAAAMIAAGCSKEAITPAEEEIPQTGILAFTPEFDMEVEVKSVELGKADIWCFLYDADEKTYSAPFKQTEINGTSYLYSIPKKDNLYATFVMMPQGADINSIKWVRHLETILSIGETIFTTEPPEIYMTSYANWSESLSSQEQAIHGGQYQYIRFDNSGSANISTILRPAINKYKIRFSISNLPEGVTIESLIRKVHININADTNHRLSVAIDEMYDENDDSVIPTTKWKCRDLYFTVNESNFNLSSQDYRIQADIAIETTDNRIFTQYITLDYGSPTYSCHNIPIDYNTIKQ